MTLKSEDSATTKSATSTKPRSLTASKTAASASPKEQDDGLYEVGMCFGEFEWISLVFQNMDITPTTKVQDDGLYEVRIIFEFGYTDTDNDFDRIFSNLIPSNHSRWQKVPLLMGPSPRIGAIMTRRWIMTRFAALGWQTNQLTPANNRAPSSSTFYRKSVNRHNSFCLICAFSSLSVRISQRWHCRPSFWSVVLCWKCMPTFLVCILRLFKSNSTSNSAHPDDFVGVANLNSAEERSIRDK